MTPEDFDFMGETKLMGYGESDSSGAWIKLQVLPEELETFRGLKGEVFETSLRNVDRGPIKTKPEKGPYGEFARDLVLSGFFNSGKVREHFGGDEAYQAWCRTQQCALTGLTPTEYAHVRRAGEAGVGYKPKYMGIPLTHEAHAYQHQHGEAACLQHYKMKTGDLNPKEWFEHQVQYFVKTWLVSAMKHELSLDSMTNLSPTEFYGWAVLKQLNGEIPNKLTCDYGQEDFLARLLDAAFARRLPK